MDTLSITFDFIQKNPGSSPQQIMNGCGFPDKKSVNKFLYTHKNSFRKEAKVDGTKPKWFVSNQSDVEISGISNEFQQIQITDSAEMLRRDILKVLSENPTSSAREISTMIFGEIGTAKMVNPMLYKLKASGDIIMEKDNKTPLWSMAITKPSA